jgi:hypothetical protein
MHCIHLAHEAPSLSSLHACSVSVVQNASNAFHGTLRFPLWLRQLVNENHSAIKTCWVRERKVQAAAALILTERISSTYLCYMLRLFGHGAQGKISISGIRISHRLTNHHSCCVYACSVLRILNTGLNKNKSWI